MTNCSKKISDFAHYPGTTPSNLVFPVVDTSTNPNTNYTFTYNGLVNSLSVTLTGGTIDSVVLSGNTNLVITERGGSVFVTDLSPVIEASTLWSGGTGIGSVIHVNLIAPNNASGIGTAVISASGLTGTDNYTLYTDNIRVTHNTNTKKIVPLVDGESALQITTTDGTTPVFDVDTLNKRIGINTNTPMDALHLIVQDTDPNNYNQLNNAVIDGPITADKGFVLADSGTTKWQQYIYRNELGRFYYTYSFESELDIFVMSDAGRFGVNQPSDFLNYHCCYMDPTQGSGTDDCLLGGIFLGGDITRYEISITTTGAVDKWSWRKSIDGGVTWILHSGETNCSLSETILDHGVTVTFENVNGHNLYDVWQVNAFPQNPTGTLTVAPAPITEINLVTDYTDPNTAYSDRTYSLSSNNSPIQDIFELGTNSAIYVGSRVKFVDLYFDIKQPAIGLTLNVEYWNGSAWVSVINSEHYVDETNNLTIDGLVKFGLEFSSWEKRYPEYNPSEDGYNLYWVRITSSTPITQCPTTHTITANGRYRIATYAAHYDYEPSFYVDSVGRVVVGNASIRPNGSLTVNGSVAYKVDQITTSLILDETHNIIICNNTIPITLTLPRLETADNRVYDIVTKGTADVLLDTYNGATVDGQATYTCIPNNTYTLAGDKTNGDWMIINNVLNILAEFVELTPNGNITSTNVEDGIYEVRNIARQELVNHTGDTSNPHQVTAAQSGYVNSIYNTTNSGGMLDEISEIMNYTIGTGILSQANTLSLHTTPYTTILDVAGNTGYINYEGFFDKVTWGSTEIDFTGKTTGQYYVYVDSNGNVLNSIASVNIRESITLGRVYWNGVTLLSLSQTGRIAYEPLTNMYDYLIKLGAYIYDNGCNVSVMSGASNTMKLTSTTGNVLRGLKKYSLSQISTTAVGSKYFVEYLGSDGWGINYYEQSKGGDITAKKWNDKSKPLYESISGSPVPTLIFTNGLTGVTSTINLTSILSVGDLIWLDSDGIEYMSNIESISWTGLITQIGLSEVYLGAGGDGISSVTHALPNITGGKFVKHLLLRGIDDTLHLVMGQYEYSSSEDAISDGAPIVPAGIIDVTIYNSFILIEGGVTTTLAGRLQDIRPLPFNYKVGGALGGGVSVSHHGLADLADGDDHPQYILTNGGRNLTGIQKYNSHPTFTTNLDIIDKQYADGLIIGHTTLYNHDDIALAAKLTDVQKLHGFENRTDSTLPTIITGTTFTIAGTNFNIWIKGVKYVKNTESISFSGISGIWYIKYDVTGTLTATQTDWDLYNDVPICSVFWNGVDDGLIQEERHNSTRNIDWQANVHLTTGSRYANGLDLTINNSGFLLSSGSYLDDDINHTYSPLSECRVFYRMGSDWAWTDKQPEYFIKVGSDIQYDNNGTISACTLNYYMAYWMFITNNMDSPVYVITGQRQDATGTDAHVNNKFEDLILPDSLADVKIIYKIIVKNTPLLYTSAGSHEDYRNVTSLPNRQNGIPHSSIIDRDTKGAHPANTITTDTTNFSGLLTTADKEVQKALETLSSVSKATLGLDLVDNTSDMDKPVSNATISALSTKVDKTQTINGYLLSGNTVLTTADISDVLNKRYVTDAYLTLLSNTSGINTGDNAVNALYSGLTSSKVDKTQTINGYLLSGNTVLTTADISSVSNKRYVTDAQLILIGNTSGTNTGDNAVNALYSGLTTNATHTGDALGSTLLRVVGINGTILSGLTTGILKNTTGTGVPSIATGGSDYVVPNAAIVGNTHTKITYDSKGLVTTGTTATTADIPTSTDKNYVTDAQLVVIGNTSGTNTGDNAINPLYSGLTSPAYGYMYQSNAGGNAITLTLQNVWYGWNTATDGGGVLNTFSDQSTALSGDGRVVSAGGAGDYIIAFDATVLLNRLGDQYWVGVFKNGGLITGAEALIVTPTTTFYQYPNINLVVTGLVPTDIIDVRYRNISSANRTVTVYTSHLTMTRIK